MQDLRATQREPGQGRQRASLNPESRILNFAAGFTLFEVMLSLTLTGFLMLALLIGLRVSNRAWRTGEARLRQVHAAAERNAFIVQQISSLVPYQVTLNDPSMPGRFTVLEARQDCLRFVSTHSSVYRGRTGLVLVEYGIVEEARGKVEVALRETPVGNNADLYHMLVRSITHDVLTGAATINYQPFVLRPADLILMTGLAAAQFEYLDLHPQKGRGPIWWTDWKGRNDTPYPDAIRLRWLRADQAGEALIPLWANAFPQTETTQ